MNIAIACTEDGQLSRHFARTTHYQVFEIEDGEVRGITTLNVSAVTAPLGQHRHGHGQGNGHCHGHGHGDEHCHERGAYGHHHNHEGVLGALAGCAAVLCGGMGAGVAGSLRQAGIAPVVVEGDYTPEAAALAYVRGDLKTGAIHACCGGHGHHAHPVAPGA